MAEPHAELLNVYDETGRVTGALSREQAKRSGLALGAVNVLIVNARGEVLLQHRRADKENGARWDKTVGGHVDAGEDFDQTAVREAGEELFGDGRSSRVRLASREGFAAALREVGADALVFRRESLLLNLRDVRLRPGGGIRNVVYHVATYLGRADLPVEAFAPQADEIDGLRWAAPAEVDALLVAGELAPNMACLWLTHARALLSLPGVEPRP